MTREIADEMRERLATLAPTRLEVIDESHQHLGHAGARPVVPWPSDDAIAALLALFVALPLSMLIFKKWRIEATQTLAEYSAQRKAHKRWVQAELEGRAAQD